MACWPEGKATDERLRTHDRGLFCNWCTYTATDLAGTRLGYRPRSASSG
jgi:hypothetical protein